MIVCGECNLHMRPKKVGETFVEMAGDSPYKLWSADLWECKKCGHTVLWTTPTQQPIAEHYQPDFADKMKLYKPQHFAYDRT